MKANYSIAAVAASLATLWSGMSLAQTTYSEDFTGAATTNSWYFYNGACLTAGSSSNSTSPGQIPSCISIKSFYAQYQNGDLLVGGEDVGHPREKHHHPYAARRRRLWPAFD